MIALTFDIYLKEPLLATAIDGDPNSSVSLPFIPGSVMRGALIGRYLVQHNHISDLAGHQETRHLFFDGQTRFLNAYLADEYGKRTLPIPLAWQIQKGTDRPIYDLSVDPEPDVEGEDEPQPKPLSKSFCLLSDDGVTLYEPEKRVNVHTQRDRKMGRATEGKGAVFRYEALAPGQTFCGVILCADETAADTLAPLLNNGTLLMGGSKNAGYGLVEIGQVNRDANWSETPAPDTSLGKLVITLLSDAILRDADGQYTGFLTSEMLSEHLGVRVTLDRDCTHARHGVVGGFNRKWGLPLPQTPVARAGSVFAFRAEADIPRDRLATLLAKGIGERRAEGFGRLAVNWHTEYAQLEPRDGDSKTSSLSGTTLTEQSKKLALRMAERMLRRKMDNQLRQRVLGLSVGGGIKNTQLSAIRTLARTALSTGDAQPILGHLEQIKQASRAQFEKARVEGKPLDEWLKAVLNENADEVWRRINRSSFTTNDLPAVGDIKAKWNEPLAREYALRLIDSLLSQTLAKRRKKEER